MEYKIIIQGEAAGIAQQIAQAAIEKELGIEREKK